MTDLLIPSSALSGAISLVCAMTVVGFLCGCMNYSEFGAWGIIVGSLFGLGFGCVIAMATVLIMAVIA